jgi:hypothetical protein
MAKKTKSREIIPINVKTLIDDYIYRIDLDADYQREKIWSRKNQEELIDSILKNIDIPKIYLARVEDNDQFDFECIDGKQRMTTLLSFFKPEPDDTNPLIVRIAGERYTYKRLKKELPDLAKKIENFELTFVVYPTIDDEEFVREIFRRLQLGVRLNSGELLKTFTGTVRDFIYKEMGNDAPFFKNTKLSEKRFSRQFTLAQICLNSFKRAETGGFVRARFDDLEDFLKDNYAIDKNDKNLVRIREVLKTMDKGFGADAVIISSRAVAVTAYLFIEDLYLKKGGRKLIPHFAKFYVKLLGEIKDNMELIARYEKPTNPMVMEEFQKYILQASVEPYSIRRRHDFLESAFKYFLNAKTKGKIVGAK